MTDKWAALTFDIDRCRFVLICSQLRFVAVSSWRFQTSWLRVRDNAEVAGPGSTPKAPGEVNRHVLARSQTKLLPEWSKVGYFLKKVFFFWLREQSSCRGDQVATAAQRVCGQTLSSISARNRICRNGLPPKPLDSPGRISCSETQLHSREIGNMYLVCTHLTCRSLMPHVPAAVVQ